MHTLTFHRCSLNETTAVHFVSCFVCYCQLPVMLLTYCLLTVSLIWTCSPSLWSELARPANQRPKGAIKKKSPQTFAHLENFTQKMCPPCLIIIRSCCFDYKMNKPFDWSLCVICVSCSVHLISTYYVRKGSWAFYLNYPQINGVGKSDYMHLCAQQNLTEVTLC